MHRRSMMLVAGAAAMTLLCAGCGSTTEPATPSSPAAAPMQERWWSWAAAEPEATNVVKDRTGADCARQQPADVWFFAGTFGGALRRTCTVPAGRPIVVPLVNLYGQESDCTEFMSGADGTAVLDGKPLTAERIATEDITFTGVAGNPITEDDQRQRAKACGLWVTIPAPAAGRHTLTVRGESGTFSTEVTYAFEVRG